MQRTQLLARHLRRTMATTTTTSQSVSPAPWRSDFLDHIEQVDTPTCVFSTLRRETSGTVVPRSRTVVYRGLWASLPVNPKNPARLNPSSAYESDLLTITNDARTHKTGELLDSAPGGPAGGGASSQTGRGGPIEAVFWIVPTRTQWRVRGHAYVLGPDVESAAAAPTREAILKYMRPTGGDTEDWSWDRELTAHFGNLSPGMRGSFKNPPPGTPKSEEPRPGTGLALGQKVEDLHDEVARDNFRVVVIVPEEVDRVDLTDPAEGKRWNYKVVDGEWVTTELWP